MTSVSTILILDGKASDYNLGIDNRGFQLHRAFEDFKSLECQTWAQLGRCVDESLLVKPSGLTTSTLAHYLHEPSYTTSRIANGETADITNGCFAMIMGNAFRKDETLVFDHMHRRSDHLEEYPTQIIDRHEAFTRQILESSQAKALEWGPKCRFIWRVEQLLIFYEATVATYSVSRAGLLSHAKPIQVRLSGDSAQTPTLPFRSDDITGQRQH